MGNKIDPDEAALFEQPRLCLSYLHFFCDFKAPDLKSEVRQCHKRFRWTINVAFIVRPHFIAYLFMYFLFIGNAVLASLREDITSL